MRALARRPTTLERWPKGVHPGIVLSTREKGGGDAFFQKRIPRGRPGLRARPRGSSSRRAATPTRSAPPRWPSSAGRPRWARSRSIPGRFATTTSTIRTSCASTWTRSRARTSPTPCASPPRRATLLDELGYAGFPKTSGGRGIHIYVRIEPRWTFTDVRHAAIALRARARAAAAGPGDDEVVEGGARRAHLRRLQPERARPHDRLGLQRAAEAGRAGLRAGDLGRAPRRRARGLHGRDDARALRRGRRSPRRDRRRRPLAPAAAGHVRARRGGATCPTRPTIRRCRASRSAFSPRATATARGAEAPAPAAASSRRAGSTGADGGGTTGPMSPSGASSRSTITGAWSLGPLPLRAWRSTQAAWTRSATGALASTRSIRIPRSWWNIPAR